MPMIAIVIPLLLLDVAVTGFVLIATGIWKIFRRQMLRGILLLAGGLILLSALFAGVVCVNFGSPTKNAMPKATRASIENAYMALETFKMDNGRYPTEKEGLASLITNPAIPSWNGPYIRPTQIPADPWGTPYRYILTNGVPLVISAGPDMRFGTKDDIR